MLVSSQVRDVKESVSWKVASFLLACLVVPAGDVAGVVASMEGCLQGMSSVGRVLVR